MRTDITIENLNYTLIIDTKFYSKTLQDYQGSMKIHSDHLYQLYAYLRNYDLAIGEGKNIEGLLLYPKVDMDLSIDTTIQGYRLRAETIDLGLDWLDIDRQLRTMIG